MYWIETPVSYIFSIYYWKNLSNQENNRLVPFQDLQITNFHSFSLRKNLNLNSAFKSLFSTPIPWRVSGCAGLRLAGSLLWHGAETLCPLAETSQKLCCADLHLEHRESVTNTENCTWELCRSATAGKQLRHYGAWGHTELTPAEHTRPKRWMHLPSVTGMESF